MKSTLLYLRGIDSWSFSTWTFLMLECALKPLLGLVVFGCEDCSICRHASFAPTVYGYLSIGNSAVSKTWEHVLASLAASSCDRVSLLVCARLTTHCACTFLNFFSLGNHVIGFHIVKVILFKHLSYSTKLSIGLHVLDLLTSDWSPGKLQHICVMKVRAIHHAGAVINTSLTFVKVFLLNFDGVNLGHG